MFFKELFAWYILFSYQCSLVLLIGCLPQQLLHIIMSLSICQQLFSTFFQLIFALSKKALKTRCFSVVCCCRVQQPWLIYTCIQQKSTIFLKIFSKRQLDQYAQFSFLFLCTLYTSIKNNTSEIPSEVFVTSIYYSSIQNSTPFS